MTDELKKKLDIQEKEIKSLNDVILNLKNILDGKEAELTAMKNVSQHHKELNGKLREELDEVKADNKKLAQQVEDLKIEAKDMLAYP